MTVKKKSNKIIKKEIFKNVLDWSCVRVGIVRVGVVIITQNMFGVGAVLTFAHFPIPK